VDYTPKFGALHLSNETAILMANSRSSDKRHLNAWIFERSDAVLNRVAKENQMTKTELVEYLISQLEEKESKEIEKWKNKKKK
tara:strand:+ start:515 stop:763 length:249 start_codon:yes stop_codon:yes gene_type:complete